MDRRRFLLTSLAGALAAPLVGEAQQAAKVLRIGLLVPGLPPGCGIDSDVLSFAKTSSDFLGATRGPRAVTASQA